MYLDEKLNDLLQVDTCVTVTLSERLTHPLFSYGNALLTAYQGLDEIIKQDTQSVTEAFNDLGLFRSVWQGNTFLTLRENPSQFFTQASDCLSFDEGIKAATFMGGHLWLFPYKGCLTRHIGVPHVPLTPT